MSERDARAPVERLGREQVEPGADAASDTLVEVRGRLGLITLNRPRALNALTHGMVGTIRAALDVWALDDAVSTVAIVGAGDRGLCAGGDIVSLYRDATTGGGAASAAFWRDEYRLNALIARYPKPFVAIMDGVVLGGGIGLSAHGSHRVVTERSKIGMPETAIGFVPDVGGTWLLSRAPGELGTHLALTAAIIGAGDAIAVGLADSFVASERLGSLVSALESANADEAIAAHCDAPPSSKLIAERRWIDAAYAGDDVGTILERLRSTHVAAAGTAAESIAAKSPTALAITLAALRRAAKLGSLEEVLAQEYRVSLRALRSPDFAEGVRAQVIDKDRSPRWSPRTGAEVDVDLVAASFAPLTRDEEAALDTSEWTAS